MSNEELARDLLQIANDTELEAGQLAQSAQKLKDHAKALSEILVTGATGIEVSKSFSAAADALEKAIDQLNAAAQGANDYAHNLMTL